MKTQECSTEGCAKAAAFTTRTKPAWCLDCLKGILRKGGMSAAEPFSGPKAYWLMTCLKCGVQTHNRLEYVLEKNAIDEKTCRACYWAGWAEEQRDLVRGVVRLRSLSEDRIIKHLDANGFDLVTLVSEANDGNGPIITKCRACGRISAQRMGDIGWGCACTRNGKSSAPYGRGIPLVDSDSSALKWWDHERNDEAALRSVTLLSTRLCHWLCPKCGAQFEAKVREMTQWLSCPECSARRSAQWHEEYERWKITPVSAVPELAAAWADDSDPRQVMVAGGWELRRFRCPAGHHPRIGPLTFLKSGCPHCRGAESSKDKDYLADVLPEIASQWHPTRNGKHTPQNVVWSSKRSVWWLADCCGHEWQEPVVSRNKYQRLRCPNCRTILDSLAWQDPGLAAEWSPTNPVTAWQIRPNASTQYTPEWICATNPEHVWQAPLSGRTRGSECPECREAGKSRVELDHHAAAAEVFGKSRSGATIKDAAFTTRKSWTVDISAEAGGHRVVVEYDGAYWHAAPAKVLVDERKSLDLLAAGYAVVRLREDDLAPLAITHPRYHEIRVSSRAPRAEAVMREAYEWATGLV
ncbi:hypothetical protein HMPREF9336_00804 [Segniliparus rugosus ATCC BAA-974]|uniref:Treble clef zinc finger domain-containing protein n=2 Tax=Segniliparus rugosus TaxID=286804 RepID=E5XMT4_SEGRC|nr:hypothetical protein HMPREF9336_00804 [Segniliparus rugosus ATCC BAA-974]